MSHTFRKCPSAQAWGLSSTGCRGISARVPPPVSLTSVLAGLFFYTFSPHSSLVVAFCPFLNAFFPEALPRGHGGSLRSRAGRASPHTGVSHRHLPTHSALPGLHQPSASPDCFGQRCPLGAGLLLQATLLQVACPWDPQAGGHRAEAGRWFAWGGSLASERGTVCRSLFPKSKSRLWVIIDFFLKLLLF